MSATWYSKCPQCGARAMTESGNGYKIRICPVCGSTEEAELVGEGENYEKLVADGWELHPSADGSCLRKAKRYRGYGSVRFAKLNGCSQVCQLSKRLSDDEVANLLREFDDGGIDKSRCYVTRWNDEKQELEVLWGKIDFENDPDEW